MWLSKSPLLAATSQSVFVNVQDVMSSVTFRKGGALSISKSLKMRAICIAICVAVVPTTRLCCQP